MSTNLRGIFALLVVTIAWGTTFPAMKDLSSFFTPAWIVFLRFFLAAILLTPFLRGIRRQDLLIGLGMGLLLFVCYVFQVEGLALTSSNRNAFITGLNVLLVPLLGILLGSWPEKRIILAVLLAVIGLFALCWDGGSWSYGDTLTLFCALAYAIYVKLMEVYSRRVSSLMSFTAVQVSCVCLCALLWLLITEVPIGGVEKEIDLLNYLQHIGHGIRLHWINLVYLGAICTAAIISLQTWGQSHTSANEAAVVYAFEPACAAIAAYFWIDESMGPRAIFGAILMIVGMIVSQWNHASEKKLLVPD